MDTNERIILSNDHVELLTVVNACQTILSKHEEFWFHKKAINLKKRMGKNKGSQKHQKPKDVFKLATVRSVKLKAKAQKVVSNLKDLDLKGQKTVKEYKNKTARIDELLQELRKEVEQCKTKMKANNAKHGKKREVQNSVPVEGDVSNLIEHMQI